MEEYIRLFFTGEALQRIFSFMCNNNNRDVQYKISNMISSMLKTTLCIRLTPLGLAPFRHDISMVLPYSMMDRTQLDFLDNIVHAVSCSSGTKNNPTQVLTFRNGVVVVTVLNSVKIWSGSSTDKTPLSHRHRTTTTHKNIAITDPADTEAEKLRISREEASRALDGRPIRGSLQWQLDTLDLLKAFVACVFRSTTFQDDNTRSGICEIVVQMVMHDVGLTHNTVDMLKKFVQGIRCNHERANKKQCT